MPVEMLRTYAASLARVGGVMAFRGMPGGMTRVEPMAKLSAQTLRLDPGCEGPACAMRDVQIIVDPLIFRQHGVTKVPALAMIPGDPTQPYCERDENSPAPPMSSTAMRRSPDCSRNMAVSAVKRRYAMLSLIWRASKRAASELKDLPLRAAVALGASGFGEPARPVQLFKAYGIVLPIGLLVWWAMPQSHWWRRPRSMPL
jgi:hypothetical protein